MSGPAALAQTRHCHTLSAAPVTSQLPAPVPPEPPLPFNSPSAQVRPDPPRRSKLIHRLCTATPRRPPRRSLPPFHPNTQSDSQYLPMPHPLSLRFPSQPSITPSLSIVPPFPPSLPSHLMSALLPHFTLVFFFPRVFPPRRPSVYPHPTQRIILPRHAPPRSVPKPPRPARPSSAPKLRGCSRNCSSRGQLWADIRGNSCCFFHVNFVEKDSCLPSSSANKDGRGAHQQYPGGGGRGGGRAGSCRFVPFTSLYRFFPFASALAGLSSRAETSHFTA